MRKCSRILGKDFHEHIQQDVCCVRLNKAIVIVVVNDAALFRALALYLFEICSVYFRNEVFTLRLLTIGLLIRSNHNHNHSIRCFHFVFRMNATVIRIYMHGMDLNGATIDMFQI